MLFKESLISAISSIRSNSIRSFLTSLAIIIGTAAVIAVIGIGSSAEKALEASIDDLGGRTLYVAPGQNRRGAVTKGIIPLDIKDAEALANFKDIKWEISPTITRNRQVKFGNANINQRIGAYLPIHFGVRGYELESGRLFDENDNLGRKRVVVVGSKIPSELKTRAGNLLNKEILIAGTSYKVIGILKEEGSTGWQNPDEELYIPLLTGAQRVFGTPNVDSINVGISNDMNVDEVMMSIEQILRAKHDIGPGQDNDFRISDYSQFSDLRRQATGIFTLLIAAIAGISLVVGGIGVMNIMLVSVTERTREIGLRKSIGATPKIIRDQFLIESILICLIGGIGGITLGILFGNIVTIYIGGGNFIIPWLWIIMGLLISTLVGILSGYIPAKKAAALDPIESLRFE